MADAIAIAQAAAARGYAKREAMREVYPGAALVTDWIREGGPPFVAVRDVAADKWFGTRTADALPPMLVYASEIAAAVADGRIRIAGEWKDRRGRLQQRLAPTQEDHGDV